MLLEDCDAVERLAVKQLKQIFAPSGRLFYGWYIVASAGGLQMLASLLWMQSYGAYVIFLQQEFGWSKTLVAGAFALTRIESGVLGQTVDLVVDASKGHLDINRVVSLAENCCFSFLSSRRRRQQPH